MRFPLRVFLCLAFVFCSISSFGASDKPEPQSAQAVLLDHSTYHCNNCLFGVSYYYFCFDVNSRIMVGYEPVRTQMRKKAPDNLLGKRGQTVPIRFDDRYIWTPGPNGKDIRITQDYTKQVFLFNDACKKAVTPPVTE